VLEPIRGNLMAKFPNVVAPSTAVSNDMLSSVTVSPFFQTVAECLCAGQTPFLIVRRPAFFFALDRFTFGVGLSPPIGFFV